VKRGFDNENANTYTISMFVSIVCEFSNDDHKKFLYDLFLQYGCKRIMEHLYESVTMTEKALLRLKRDIDRHTDGYDRVRIYQYPMEGGFVISNLYDNRWRRTIVKP